MERWRISYKLYALVQATSIFFRKKFTEYGILESEYGIQMLLSILRTHSFYPYLQPVFLSCQPAIDCLPASTIAIHRLSFLTAHTGALKKEREADLNPKVNNAGYPSPA